MQSQMNAGSFFVHTYCCSSHLLSSVPFYIKLLRCELWAPQYFDASATLSGLSADHLEVAMHRAKCLSLALSRRDLLADLPEHYS